MKELTIEQKAKAYDEALERAKNWYVDSQIDFKKSLENLFPELKKSKDEMIKKSLIDYFNRFKSSDMWDESFSFGDVVSWIKKQGQAKESVISQHENKTCKEKDDFLTCEDEKIRKEIRDFICWSTDRGCITKEQVEKSNSWLAWLEKIERQKEKPADKVEPKFKVGNWYQCTKDFFGKGVTFDKNTAYYCAKEGCLQNEYGCHIAIVKDLYDNFKLWTIQDAKDGDVLVYGGNPLHVEIIMLFNSMRTETSAFTHFHIFDDKFRINDWCDCGKAAHPATKVQRELLFAKMKEAGYEWDAEKKELKKIEQKSWSEEDEEKFRDVIRLVEQGAPVQSIRDHYTNWLKSLRDRVQLWNTITDEELAQAKKNANVTYHITPNQQFFQWIYNRLINVHNENPNVDYMLSLKERIENMNIQ